VCVGTGVFLDNDLTLKNYKIWRGTAAWHPVFSLGSEGDPGKNRTGSRESPLIAADQSGRGTASMRQNKNATGQALMHPLFMALKNSHMVLSDC